MDGVCGGCRRSTTGSGSPASVQPTSEPSPSTPRAAASSSATVFGARVGRSGTPPVGVLQSECTRVGGICPLVGVPHGSSSSVLGRCPNCSCRSCGNSPCLPSIEPWTSGGGCSCCVVGPLPACDASANSALHVGSIPGGPPDQLAPVWTSI